MMKKFKVTWVLAAALISLIVCVYFFEIEGGKKRAAIKEKEQMVLPLEKDKVQEVALQIPNGLFKAKRIGENDWAIEEPLKVKGDKWAWNQIIDTVSDLKFKRVIEEHASDLSVYGLKEPKIKVEFQFKGENEKKVLKVGDENPIGDSLFATVSNTKKVVLVPSFLSSSLNKEFKQLREKKLFSFETEKTRVVEVISEGKKLSLKKDGNKWSVVSSSKKEEAVLSQVTGLLNTLNSLEVKDFESESPADLSKYGLKDPSMTVRVKDEKNVQLELLLGKKDKEGVFAVKKGEKPVYRLHAYVVDDISLDASKYVMKKEEKKPDDRERSTPP